MRPSESPRLTVSVSFLLVIGCRFDTTRVARVDKLPTDSSADTLSSDASTHTFDLSAPDLLAPDGQHDLPDALLPDAARDGPWYQADEADCPKFCTTRGLSNEPSPEGARCMSGEIRPQSGIDQGINFTFGCWPDCAPMGAPLDTNSKGKHCYYEGKKQDNDTTDRTVGCFCR